MTEDGRTEPYRVQFPSTVGNALERLAILESRSVPNLIRDLTIEALVKRQVEEIALSLKEKFIRNGDNGQLVKTGCLPENASDEDLIKRPLVSAGRKAA